ncbi:MAG: DUF4188 domain-containing protein [Planctomycetota bacterium]|nr:DUF4188 domain-containing protein [Planctomycetota bacterium]RLS24218.1 MAG: DUF4188 domain-containing protein [Planctomycetota bacterium]
MMSQALAWQWPERLGERFCLIRFGMIASKARALPQIWRYTRAIEQSARAAIDQQSGLLKSERIMFRWNHFGFLQYWSDLDQMLAWTHNEPHTAWWKSALDRQRQSNDLVIYHETYLVNSKGFEAIYLGVDQQRPGASAFGQMVLPKGGLATAKARLAGDQAPLLTGQAAKIKNQTN